MRNRDTAILVVNGGKDPEEGRWLSLFLKNLVKYTDRDKFELLVWNNNVNDPEVKKLEEKYNFHLVEPFPGDNLFHPHAVPLQRLFNIAVQSFGSKYIIVMDSDAFPVKKGWFEELRNGISSNKYQLAGVWRDELSNGIRPYVHPSCMCFSTQFVIDHDLRLDEFGLNSEDKKHDTMSSFTDKGIELQLSILKWKRSNKNNFHRLMGGIYGDFIYHHGAGSRTEIGFWDEEYLNERSNLYNRINSLASSFLFNDLDSYLDWLRGGKSGEFSNYFSDINFSQEPYTGLTKKEGLKKKILGLKKHILKPRNTSPKRVESLLFENMRGIPSKEMIANLRAPKGWHESLPDIVGLGVPKAGTSWWFDIILNHSHIVPHRFYNSKSETSKELNFFSHFGHKKIDDYQKSIYRQCFLKQEKVLCAEFSTTYLHHFGSINNLLQTIKEDTVLVIILRNPVDRYFSHINHVLNNRAKLLGLSEDEMEIFRKYSVLPEAHNYSLYSDVISYLFSKAGKRKIFFDVYENIVADPNAGFHRFIDFIGLNPYPGLEVDFSQTKNKQQYNIGRPTFQERKLVSEYFLNDVKRLKTILPDQDFSRWREFNI